MDDIVFDTNDFLVLEFEDLAPGLRPTEIVFDSYSIIMENPSIPSSGGGSGVGEAVTIFIT